MNRQITKQNYFHLEIVRDRSRFNLGYIWPNLAPWELHRPYLYMITSIQANFEVMRTNFRDLTIVRCYRCGPYLAFFLAFDCSPAISPFLLRAVLPIGSANV